MSERLLASNTAPCVYSLSSMADFVCQVDMGVEYRSIVGPTISGCRVPISVMSGPDISKGAPGNGWLGIRISLPGRARCPLLEG